MRDSQGRQARDDCCRAKWVKLNKDPVCFGGKESSYGMFAAEKNHVIHKVKFVYRSGTIHCDNKANPPYTGYFDCDAPFYTFHFTVFLTDAHNKVIVPAPPVRFRNNNAHGWYSLHGQNRGTTMLTLSTGMNSYEMVKGHKYRIWHGEDLFNHGEQDNEGQTCTDVYGLV